jgi:hypothetical protein
MDLRRKTMEFQVFSMTDPTCRLIQVIEADSKTEALSKAQAINQNYAVAPMPPKVRVRPRESGRAYDVVLREAVPTLGVAQGLVTNALIAQGGHTIDVFTDGSARFMVGDDLFTCIWAVSDDDEVELGQPEQIEMVPQPVESRRSLHALSEALNPGRSDQFHAEFARGRNARANPLEDIGIAFGLQAKGLREFLRGRD